MQTSDLRHFWGDDFYNKVKEECLLYFGRETVDRLIITAISLLKPKAFVPHSELCDIDRETVTFKRDIKAGETYNICSGCLARLGIK